MQRVLMVLGALLQESEEGDGIAQLLFLLLLIAAVVGVVGFMFMLLPVLIAIRHGWRWTLAAVAATWLAAWPLRAAFESDDLAHASWGFLSFPLWIAIAVIARRGPPEWFPGPRRAPPSSDGPTDHHPPGQRP